MTMNSEASWLIETRMASTTNPMVTSTCSIRNMMRHRTERLLRVTEGVLTSDSLCKLNSKGNAGEEKCHGAPYDGFLSCLSMRRMVAVKSIFCFCWARVQEGKPHLCASWNPTIERCGFAGELGTLWNGGERMTYEEMMQIEEARVVAEQKAWERLHEAIFKELFKKTDKQSTGSGIGAMNTQPCAHRVGSQNDLLGLTSCTPLLTEL